MKFRAELTLFILLIIHVDKISSNKLKDDKKKTTIEVSLNM